MLFKKTLKRVTFEWDDEYKKLQIVENNRQAIEFQPYNMVYLTKSEMGSLQRFIFSMVQFHSQTKRKVVKKDAENQNDNEE